MTTLTPTADASLDRFFAPEAAEFFDDGPDIDFDSIGLSYETWANDADWQALAAQGIDPITAVRLVSPDFADMDTESLTQVISEQVWEMDPYEQAEFWKHIKKAARKVAGVAAKVAKPLLTKAGTAVGTFFGGPAGAAIGAKVGGSLGGLASRGLKQLSQKGGYSRMRAQLRRNINTARTRVRRGQPVFTNQQVTGALAQLRALLASNEAARLVEQAGSYPESLSVDSADHLLTIVGDVIDIANQLEAALDESAYDGAYIEAYADSYQPDAYATTGWRG